ncbi:hypothetical protein BLOT_006721 [Blomia tropicalis]|nr:hypothetical protein BLOT_006721 [Blomia tropicalis]
MEPNRYVRHTKEGHWLSYFMDPLSSADHLAQTIEDQPSPHPSPETFHVGEGYNYRPASFAINRLYHFTALPPLSSNKRVSSTLTLR